MARIQLFLAKKNTFFCLKSKKKPFSGSDTWASIKMKENIIMQNVPKVVLINPKQLPFKF